MLERSQPRPVVEVEADPVEAVPKGRGVTLVAKPDRAPAVRTAKRIKGRTIYIADDLWERIIVSAHRRDVTISDYVYLLLERHVPDHRVIRSSASSAAPDPADERDVT